MIDIHIKFIPHFRNIGSIVGHNASNKTTIAFIYCIYGNTCNVTKLIKFMRMARCNCNFNKERKGIKIVSKQLNKQQINIIAPSVVGRKNY